MAIEFTNNYGIKYYDVSPKTGKGIKELFKLASEDFMELNSRK